ncbi:MAG: PQQ-dependent sugar dehydrogenase [Fimbriimonas sp.]
MTASLVALSLLAAPQSAETVADGLSVVWDIEFASRNRAYILERDNRVRLWENGRLRPQPYARIPGVVQKGQGGLQDLCLAPDYAKSRLVYFTYTVEDANGIKLRMARFRDTGSGFRFERTLFEGPSKGDPAHFGARMTFGPGGKLFLTLGERHDKERAQAVGRPNGKVMRFNPDGSAPRDNPFFSQGGPARFVWTYGHRNPQGIAYDRVGGTLAVSEHGPSRYDAPRGFDEVNILRKGANYGWPLIWGGDTRGGMRVADKWWEEPVAPGGAAFLGRDLLVPMLNGKSLWRLKISGGRVTDSTEVLGDEHGRLRCATVGPDGAVYVGTSNGENGRKVDKVLRLRI